jgi:hypothetical protein
MSYWWMSFCDPEKPKGQKFLGALVIRADDHFEMMKRSWMLELNPGGEVAFFEIPKQYEERIPHDWIETRLLTKNECEEFEHRWMP